MGLLANGTVVPTPRDRVMDYQEEVAMHIQGQKALAFELWTTTQEIYTGESIEAWNDFPDVEIQWMVIKSPDGSIHQITGVEEYKFGTGASRIKRGPWMDDVEYFKALPEFVAGTSKLL